MPYKKKSVKKKPPPPDPEDLYRKVAALEVATQRQDERLGVLHGILRELAGAIAVRFDPYGAEKMGQTLLKIAEGK